MQNYGGLKPFQQARVDRGQNVMGKPASAYQPPQTAGGVAQRSPVTATAQPTQYGQLKPFQQARVNRGQNVMGQAANSYISSNPIAQAAHRQTVAQNTGTPGDSPRPLYASQPGAYQPPQFSGQPQGPQVPGGGFGPVGAGTGQFPGQGGRSQFGFLADMLGGTQPGGGYGIAVPGGQAALNGGGMSYFGGNPNFNEGGNNALLQALLGRG